MLCDCTGTYRHKNKNNVKYIAKIKQNIYTKPPLITRVRAPVYSEKNA